MAKKTNIKSKQLQVLITKVNSGKKTSNELIELTKIELATIYLLAQLENLYSEIRRHHESQAELLIKQHVISSLINDLSVTINNVLPKELNALKAANKKLSELTSKISGIKIDEEDYSLYYFGDFILKETLRQKIKLNGYDFEKELNNQLQHVLKTFDEDPKYVILGQNEPVISSQYFKEVVYQTRQDNGKIVDILLLALEKLSSKHETLQRIYKTGLAKNKIAMAKAELQNKNTIKLLSNLLQQLSSMSSEMSTVYENLELLINEPDKKLEKETVKLYDKCVRNLEIPRLTKNGSFIKDFETTKNDFQLTHMVFVDDEGLGGGSIINQAISKIESAIQ